MQYSILITGLIGLLTGSLFGARVLIAVCAVVFLAALTTLLLAGWPVWAAFAGAFGLNVVTQVFYVVGLLLAYGKSQLVARIAGVDESKQDLQHRAGGTVL